MIRTEAEYQRTVALLTEQRAKFAALKREWRKAGLTPAEVERAAQPMEGFHGQLADDVEIYERLRRGELGELENLNGLGEALIGLRIAAGITQRELARRLGVDETMVSRDECNEYHGITVERASKVLEALGGRLTTRVELVERRKAS